MIKMPRKSADSEGDPVKSATFVQAVFVLGKKF